MSKQKQKKTPVVLSIYPNSRGFGYSVHEKALKVIDTQVISIRPISNAIALKRIKEIIDYYKPEIVVLEDYNGMSSRKSNRVQKLIDIISKYAKKTEVYVKTYSRADIRFVFSSFNAHTKHEIATVITENVPFMKNRIMKKRKTTETEKYMASSFDAVSLGITHYYSEE